MKEKYKRFFDNGTQTIHEICYVVIFFIVTTPVILTIDSEITIVPLSILFVLIIMACESLKTKAYFAADDTQVTFSYFIKYTFIRYDEIERLLIERHHNERRVKGGTERCYVETIKIITTDGKTYQFSAKMDIDYDKVAANPAYLTEQFENSQFSRLKRHIEDSLNSNIMFPQQKNYI